ncbi:MAG: GTP-binding protein [Myxococcota bacterium]|jgi:G3E family GTPase|nr:GTP-binding protein [Myxococcota bacterium]
MVPVHVISGALGTGKTTTILDQVARLGDRERIAVIVNDFGQSSFDGIVLGETGQATIREIPGACVCCTAPEGFMQALADLLHQVEPDRIFVEPTGLANPEDLVDSIRRGPFRDRIALGPVIHLVDASTLDPSGGTPSGDVVVGSRSDLAGPTALEAFEAWSQALWPTPLRILTMAHGQLPSEALEWPEGTGSSAPRVQLYRLPEDSTHGHSAWSWQWTPDQRFSARRLRTALEAMRAGTTGHPVARLKGIFVTDEGVLRLDIASSELHEARSGIRRGSLVDVILETEDQSAFDQIGDAFSDALQTEAERASDPTRLVLESPGTQAVSLDRQGLLELPGGVSDVSRYVPGRQGAATRLRAVLDAHGLWGPYDIAVSAHDGMTTPRVPLSALAEALLLHSLDGEPLPPDKGGPFRLLIPGDAGPGGPCANVKGVVRVALYDSIVQQD